MAMKSVNLDNQQHRPSTSTRRSYLQVGSALAVSLSIPLAGCTFSTSQQQYITYIELIPKGITAHLNTSSLPDQVNLVAPDGTIAQKRSITTGQETVEFSTITDDLSVGRSVYSSVPISSGKYTIAAKGDSSTQEESVPLSHSIKLTDLSITTDTQQGDSFPSGLNTTIKNTGTLPFRVDNITIEGQFPAAAADDYTSNPSYQRLDIKDDTSVDEYMLSNKTGVIVDTRDSASKNRSFSHQSGRFKTINTSPFLYQSDPYGKADTPLKRQFCGTETPFTLVIKSPNDLTRRFTVRADYGSSTMSIGGLSGTYYTCTPIRIAKYQKVSKENRTAAPSPSSPTQ